jgi:hypothetical protein
MITIITTTIVVIIIFLTILLIFGASLLLATAMGRIRRLRIELLVHLIMKVEGLTKWLILTRWCGVNIKLLLNLIKLLKRLLLMLGTSTTSSKHVLHEELELVGGLTTGGGGLRLLTMSLARARSTWWRSPTGGRTRSTLAFTSALSNLLELALGPKCHLVG